MWAGHWLSEWSTCHIHRKTWDQLPHTHFKKLRKAACPYNSSAVWAYTGLMASQYKQLLSSKFGERPYLKSRMESNKEGHLLAISGLHIHLQTAIMNLHTCTLTWIHTYFLERREHIYKDYLKCTHYCCPCLEISSRHVQCIDSSVKLYT